MNRAEPRLQKSLGGRPEFSVSKVLTGGTVWEALTMAVQRERFLKYRLKDYPIRTVGKEFHFG